MVPARKGGLITPFFLFINREMAEIIEALNQTSVARTIFYVIVFLIALGIVFDGIASIVKYLRK